MPTARKLPSGSWRCKAYDYTDNNGKRIYRSFTSQDKSRAGKRKAELMAIKFFEEKNERKKAIHDQSVQQIVGNYIELKKNVLAQTTIRGYKTISQNLMTEISNKPIGTLTNVDIQLWISNIAATHSPKTVKNAYGLLTAAFGMYLPDMHFKITLPQQVKPDLYIPTDEDIQKVICYFRENDRDMLIAVYLAAFGTLRRSEICALSASDIKGNTVRINKAMIKTTDHKWIIKTTKNFASTRMIELPQFVIDILPTSGPLVSINPTVVSSRFIKHISNIDVPKFRFHDLRHYSASVMHAIGIPDEYIMKRGGWASDYTLKQIYRGTMNDYEKKFTEKTVSHFNNMIL